MESAVAEWLTRFVGPDSAGLMLFVFTYFASPVIAAVMFYATFDITFSILGVAVLNLLGGGIGFLLAVTNYTVGFVCFCVWKEDFVHMFLYGLAAAAIYCIWLRFFKGMWETPGC